MGCCPPETLSRVTPLEALRPAVVDVETTKRVSKKTIAGIVLILVAGVGLFTGNISFVALGGLSFLVGLVLIAPALVKPIANLFGALIGFVFAREGTAMLAQGNLARRTVARRQLLPAQTMIGLAIIVASIGLMTSLTSGINDILEKSLGSDYLLVPPSIGIWSSDVGADEGLADRLRARIRCPCGEHAAFCSRHNQR